MREENKHIQSPNNSPATCMSHMLSKISAKYKQVVHHSFSPRGGGSPSTSSPNNQQHEQQLQQQSLVATTTTDEEEEKQTTNMDDDNNSNHSNEQVVEVVVDSMGNMAVDDRSVDDNDNNNMNNIYNGSNSSNSSSNSSMMNESHNRKSSLDHSNSSSRNSRSSSCITRGEKSRVGLTIQVMSIEFKKSLLSLHFGIYISPFVCFGCEETQTTAQSSVSQYNFTILGGSNSPSTMTHHHLDEYGQNRHHRSNSNVSSSSSTSSCVVQWPANEHVFLPIEFDHHEDSETSVDESSHTGNNELRSDNNNDPTSRRETPNCNSTSNPIVGGSGGSRDDNQRIHVSIEVLHSRTLFSYHVSLGYAVLPIDCQFMERNRGKIVGVPLRREREVIAILSLKIDDHYSIFSSDVREGVSSSKDDTSISNLVGKDNSSDSDDEYMEASGTQELDQSSTMHRIHERDSMMSLCSQHSDQLLTESREDNILPEPMKDHNSEHFDHRESSMEESISLSQSIADSQDKSEMSFEERFKIKKLIGKGGMGSVFRAFDKHNNIDVAIKKIYCKSSEQVNRAMREVWPIRTLEHENLVSCNDIYFEDCVDRKGKQFAVCLVMELFSKGDLHRHINKRLENKNYIPQVDLLLMMKQLASGLLYLHDRSLLHRDLKPMNIFISARGTLKIGDFGMVKDVHKALARTTAGTQKFMAPEIFLREPYSLKADVWSLGVTYLEMMALKVDMLPYLEIYRNKSFHGDLEADLLTLKLYDREVVNIILQCLTLDPTNRPSVSQILVYISKLLGEETEQQMEEKPMLYKSTSSIISKTLSTIESIERRFGDMDTMMKDLTEYLSMDQFRKRRASSSSQSSPDASDRVDMGDETPPSGETEGRKHRRTGSLGDMFTSFFGF